MDIPIKKGSKVLLFPRGNHPECGITKHKKTVGTVTSVIVDQLGITVSGYMNDSSFGFDRYYKNEVIPNECPGVFDNHFCYPYSDCVVELL